MKLLWIVALVVMAVGTALVGSATRAIQRAPGRGDAGTARIAVGCTLLGMVVGCGVLVAGAWAIDGT